MPYHLTSAKSNVAAQRAFDAVIDAAVGLGLSKTRTRVQRRILGEKILAFVARRGRAGVSKNDLLINFKELEYSELMEEVENLQRLGILDREELGPNAFRLRATPRGHEIAVSTLWEELVVDEPV